MTMRGVGGHFEELRIKKSQQKSENTKADDDGGEDQCLGQRGRRSQRD